MKLCAVAATRRTLEAAFTSRCKAQNAPILEELVRLRAKLAGLLGYKSWAAYVQDIRMAKTPETVTVFFFLFFSFFSFFSFF